MKWILVGILSLFAASSMAKEAGPASPAKRQVSQVAPTKVWRGTSEMTDSGSTTSVFFSGPPAKEIFFKRWSHIPAKNDRDSGQMIKEVGSLRCSDGDDNEPFCVIILDDNAKGGVIFPAGKVH